MSAALTKTSLRRHFRKLRRNLPPPVQTAHANAIARSFVASSLLLARDRIGVFMSADGEPDTAPLIDRLWKIQKVVALPVIRRLSARLEFYRFEPGDCLVDGDFNIPVPPEGALHLPLLSLDLLLMPLVAFDHAGSRLGMGGGFYDRTLSTLPDSMRPLLIGIAHACQESSEPLPRSAHDIALDGVITETGLHMFKRTEA